MLFSASFMVVVTGTVVVTVDVVVITDVEVKVSPRAVVVVIFESVVCTGASVLHDARITTVKSNAKMRYLFTANTSSAIYQSGFL